MSDVEFTRAEMERLQTEQAYQADTISALNDALAGQQLELIEIRRTLKLMEASLRDVRDVLSRVQDGSPGEQEPPPPHY